MSSIATIEGFKNIGQIQNIDYFNSVTPLCFTFLILVDINHAEGSH